MTRVRAIVDEIVAAQRDVYQSGSLQQVFDVLVLASQGDLFLSPWEFRVVEFPRTLTSLAHDAQELLTGEVCVHGAQLGAWLVWHHDTRGCLVPAVVCSARGYLLSWFVCEPDWVPFTGAGSLVDDLLTVDSCCPASQRAMRVVLRALGLAESPITGKYDGLAREFQWLLKDLQRAGHPRIAALCAASLGDVS